MSKSDAFLGIDVGTGSARAAVFSGAGRRLGMGVVPITMWKPRPQFAEQSSRNIWESVCQAVRQAILEAGTAAERIVGIGFDATCSLVVLGEGDEPLPVSPDAPADQNIIVWMDHRAIEQTARINSGKYSVLDFVGGVMSPEMQPPKLLWLKENNPASFANARLFMDLPDYLVYRATGNDVRSHCTTVCKWTYRAQMVKDGDADISGWDDDFWRSIGLEDFPDEGYRRIGTAIKAPGVLAGALSEDAARELDLLPGTPVAVGIIDAHAGGLGLMGARSNSEEQINLETRLALIGGTSSCHMAVSRESRFVPGVWGPYFSAMVPDYWLTEGGQSASGALIDHVVESHPAHEEARNQAEEQSVDVYQVLERRLADLTREKGLEDMALLTAGFHVLPYHHGNRSPRADPGLRGVVSGVSLDRSIDDLALQYLATVQAVAYGTRHILDALEAHGYCIDTVLACGGGTKSSVYLQSHADATSRTIVLPEEPEAVLLGSAILGATASGVYESIPAAMAAMSRKGQTIAARSGSLAVYHARKYKVFQKMYDHLLEIRRTMNDQELEP